MTRLCMLILLGNLLATAVSADETVDCARHALAENLMGTWKCNVNYWDPEEREMVVRQEDKRIAATESGYAIYAIEDEVETRVADVSYTPTAMRYAYLEAGGDVAGTEHRVVTACAGPDADGFARLVQWAVIELPTGALLARAEFSVAKQSYRWLGSVSRDGETWQQRIDEVCARQDEDR